MAGVSGSWGPWRFVILALACVLLAGCFWMENPDRRMVRDRSIPWDHPNRIAMWNENAEHVNAVLNPIAISPMTRQLAAAVGATPQNEIQVLNYETGHVIRIRYRSGYYRVSSPTFSPDGQHLAFIAAPPSWGGVSEIILFDLEAVELVRTYGGPGDYFDKIRFTRSGDGLHVFAIDRAHADPPPGPPYQHYREIQREQLGYLSLETGVVEPLVPGMTRVGHIFSETEAGGVWLRLDGVFLHSEVGKVTFEHPKFCGPLDHEWQIGSCAGSYFWTGSQLIPYSPGHEEPRPIAALSGGRLLAYGPRDTTMAPADVVICAEPRFAEDVRCEPPGPDHPVLLGANPNPDVLNRALVGGVPTLDRQDPNARGIDIFENLLDLQSVIELEWPDTCGGPASSDPAISRCTSVEIE